MLPEFDANGFLPYGIHCVPEEGLLRHFGEGSPRRKWLAAQLREVLGLARDTGKLARVFLWGSFVTAKESPNDVDMLLVMEDDFVLEQAPKESQRVFDHNQARIHYQADIFWAKSSIGEETLRLWLDTYQVDREFRRRGIVEVVLT